MSAYSCGLRDGPAADPSQIASHRTGEVAARAPSATAAARPPRRARRTPRRSARSAGRRGWGSSGTPPTRPCRPPAPPRGGRARPNPARRAGGGRRARISCVISARTRARAPVAAVMAPSCARFRERWQESRAVLLTFGAVGAHTASRRREQCSRERKERSMGKHVIVGAGAVGQGVARELAAAGPRGGGGVRGRAGPGGRRRARRVARRDRRRRADRRVHAAPTSSTTAPTPRTTRTGRGEWPPLAASLLQAAEDTGAGYVIMGNLYGYGPVAGPIRPDDCRSRRRCQRSHPRPDVGGRARRAPAPAGCGSRRPGLRLRRPRAPGPTRTSATA